MAIELLGTKYFLGTEIPEKVKKAKINEIITEVNSLSLGELDLITPPSGTLTVDGELAVEGDIIMPTFNISANQITVDNLIEATTGKGITVNSPLIRKGSQVQKNITASLTAAELAGGFITSTSAAAVALTLPTATAFATQVGGVRGAYFDFVIDNSLGANTITVVVNTGITVGTTALTGGDTLTISTAQVVGMFRLVFTSTTTAILRRIF